MPTYYRILKKGETIQVGDEVRTGAEWCLVHYSIGAKVHLARTFRRAITKEEFNRAKRNRLRKEKDEAMKSLGLTKVRGALGRTYWE